MITALIVLVLLAVVVRLVCSTEDPQQPAYDAWPLDGAWTVVRKDPTGKVTVEAEGLTLLRANSLVYQLTCRHYLLKGHLA